MSKSIVVGILSFIGGAVISGALTYKYVMVKNEVSQEKKAEAIKAQLEAYYENKYEEKKYEEKKPVSKMNVDVSEELIHVEPMNTAKSPYNMDKKDYSKYQKVVERYMPKEEKPTNIEQEEVTFEIVDSNNMEEDWDVLGFTLYSDGIVTDENDDPVEDISEHIGDTLYFFDKQAGSLMYVKNNHLQAYYEISYEEYTYAEAHSDDNDVR